MSILTHFSDVLVPYFDLYLNGHRVLDYQRLLIEEIVFEDTSTGSDLLHVTMRDPDFHFLSDPMIMQASPVTFYGGWKNNYKKLFEGYISMVDCDFGDDGTPSLVLTCMDKSYNLNRVERKAVFKNMRNDQIVTQIAKQNGLQAIVDNSGKVNEDSSQSYETDIQFINGLASQDDFICWVKDDKIYYKRLKPYTQQNPAYYLWYKNSPYDVISFKPRVVQADTDTDSSTAATRDIKYNVEGTAELLPILDLTARQVIHIQGVGANFTGNYFINTVSHTWNRSGYTQSVDVLRNDFIWKSTNPTPPPDNNNSQPPNTPNPKQVNYTVVEGDSLWTIAKKFYGDGSLYMKIYNANISKIPNPNVLTKGQVLVIPPL